MKARGGEKGILLPGQQGAVGDQAGAKAQAMSDGKQLRQLRMQQRFAQNMEIEIVGFAPEL